MQNQSQRNLQRTELLKGNITYVAFSFTKLNVTKTLIIELKHYFSDSSKELPSQSSSVDLCSDYCIFALFLPTYNEKTILHFGVICELAIKDVSWPQKHEKV